RPGGRRGRGEVGDSRAVADIHLTLPIAAQWVPSLSPLKGGEGIIVRAGRVALQATDREFPVGVLDQPVGAGDDHRADRVTALDVAVVIDLDAAERRLQPECRSDAVEQLTLRGAF